MEKKTPKNTSMLIKATITFADGFMLHCLLFELNCQNLQRQRDREGE